MTTDHTLDQASPVPARPAWYETSFHVRYAETDQMGMVHHSHYLVWMEEGRSAFMRALGSSYAGFEAEGFYLVVSQVQARYIAPARYDRAVTVRVRVCQVRSRSATFDYEIVDTQTGQLLVSGQTQHLCLDRSGNVTRLPPAWRQRLAATAASP